MLDLRAVNGKSSLSPLDEIHRLEPAPVRGEEPILQPVRFSANAFHFWGSGFGVGIELHGHWIGGPFSWRRKRMLASQYMRVNLCRLGIWAIGARNSFTAVPRGWKGRGLIPDKVFYG